MTEAAVTEAEAPEQEKDQLEELNEELDLMEPKKEARRWTFTEYAYDDDGDATTEVRIQRTYIQKPLSYFGKLELVAKLGEIVKLSMQGGMGIDALLTGTASVQGGRLSTADEAFVQLIAELVSNLPDQMIDLYCIILAVPRSERAWAGQVMTFPADEGGLTDEAGIEIIEVFMDQNGEILRDFFVSKIRPLFGRAMKRFGPPENEESSKSSKKQQPKAQKRSKVS